QTGPGVTDAASTLMTTLAVGTVFACLGGLLLVGALARDWAPRYLEVPVTLGVLMAAFGGAEAVSPEAGLVAATVLGVVVANQERIDSERIFRFKKSLGVILIAVLFIVLAARFEMASFY
ncbi:MAG: hypothetical protein ABEN55_08265, partial [Bradymonadaceae bacterium]